MTEPVPPAEIHFEAGEPLCSYDECYRCFEGRSILFRLVDRAKHRWFFYNDTTDTIVHVRAVFAAGSDVKSLQRARKRIMPGPNGEKDETCAVEMMLDVEPGFTEPFMEGRHTEFNLDFHTETAPARDVVFECGRPAVSYDQIYRCFKNNGNGLLFRLVDAREHHWFFYNDTREFVMKVTVTFANRAEVMPLGNTVVATPEDNAAPDSVVFTLLILPGRTEPFLQGSPVTYTLGFAAEPAAPQPVPPMEVAAHQYLHGSPDKTVIPHQTHVFRCFKEHGNGLLFRIVDDVNKIWAFYNDTPDYLMIANMRYPNSSTVSMAPGVRVLADGEREGGLIAAVEVPPLATVPFFVGALEVYELAFSAQPVGAIQSPLLPDSISGSTTPVFPASTQMGDARASPEAASAPVSMPEEAPAYLNGYPDPKVMPHIDEVHKCFKEHGNGLLFRLVDREQRRWAFYNDTTDVVASVRVQFAPDAMVQPLGNTTPTTDSETGAAAYELHVQPLETALFAQGDLGIFSTKFMAAKVGA